MSHVRAISGAVKRGLNLRSFVTYQNPSDISDARTIAYPRPGVNIELNWSLIRDEVVPAETVVAPRFFGNGEVCASSHSLAHFPARTLTDAHKLALLPPRCDRCWG